MEFMSSFGPWGGLAGIGCVLLAFWLVLGLAFEFARLTQAYDYRHFLRELSNRVLELGGESGTDAQPHLYPGSYVEYVQRTGHEAAVLFN